jgi:hypothetical protein
VQEHARLILCSFVVLAIAVMTATANARRLAISPESRFLVHFRSLSFVPPGAEENRIACPVTLAGSFHSRTISKVAGSLVGYITGATVQRPCSGIGESWALTRGEGRSETLPWHIFYTKFQGTLPNITSIELDVESAAFFVELVGLRCLYLSTAAAPVRFFADVGLEGAVSDLRAEFREAGVIPKHEGGLLCPGGLFFWGTGSAISQRGEQILVRLIQ